MHEAPKLLVEWPSPWAEFVSSIGPALSRSPARLAGEARAGLFPVRGMLLSWVAQAAFLAFLIWLPAKLASMRPYVPPTPPKYDVIYFSADELPPVQDRGGAEAGRSGRAGGKETHHRSQTIRVARGAQAVEQVVDAPDLKLPVSNAPVANLLAFKSNPGPPPAEGLKSSHTAPALTQESILAPPPETARELNRTVPGLSSSIIAPPPTNISPQKGRQMMGLSSPIVAPAPSDVPRDQSHSVVAMTSNIIQPAPDVSRDPPPLRGPASTNALVVPPPVSAPQRESAQTAKVNLPLPGVIAPPPSQVARDQHHQTGASVIDPKVVPPPAQIGGRSQDRRATPGLVGTNPIVPPPPSLANGTALNGGGSGHIDRAGGFGGILTANNVVPPPPSLSGGGSVAGRGSSDSRSGLGTAAVVPPPPNLGGPGGASTGRGTGSRGAGLGGAFDAGSVTAPPAASGNGGGSGIVLSNQPGTTKGVPGNGAAGSLAMSPGGGPKPGVGGSGDGAGIGRGNGSGSGLAGEGSGSAKAGSGRGSDPMARAGTSIYPGPGGAGSGTNGQPPVPGVSVQGGSTIVNLPSFSADGNDPNFPERSPSGGKGPGAFDITVEGTSRSGGAFNYYGLLKGDKVYTKYLPTASGTVVMQFTDTSSALRAHSVELTAPEPLRADLPAGLIHSRLDIACVLDRSGLLRNMHVLRSEPGTADARVIAALSRWKFRPAFRGSEPVEVNAILGFNSNTN